jgi:hypothetical protein
MPGYNSPSRGTARPLPRNFVLFCVLFVLCRSVYCLCVNVYCTAATRWQPTCSQQIYHIISYHIISYHIISYHIITSKARVASHFVHCSVSGDGHLTWSYHIITSKARVASHFVHCSVSGDGHLTCQTLHNGDSWIPSTFRPPTSTSLWIPLIWSRHSNESDVIPYGSDRTPVLGVSEENTTAVPRVGDVEPSFRPFNFFFFVATLWQPKGAPPHPNQYA